MKKAAAILTILTVISAGCARNNENAGLNCQLIKTQEQLDHAANGRDIDYRNNTWYVDGNIVGYAAAEDETFAWCER